MERAGSQLDRLPLGARVAIVRLRSMGDCVLTTPAIQILKTARPDLEIGVVVEDRFRAIFERNPVVSTLLGPALNEIFRWRPALCLNLHGGRHSMALTLASRAQIRAGFAHHRGAMLYHVRIPRAQEILAMSGLSIRPSISHRRCSTLVVQARRLPARACMPTPKPNRPRTQSCIRSQRRNTRRGRLTGSSRSRNTCAKRAGSNQYSSAARPMT
jgi:hypothetical protein